MGRAVRCTCPVGQASNRTVRAASVPPVPAARSAARRNQEHGAGMPREPAGKDACPTRAERSQIAGKQLRFAHSPGCD